MPHFGETTGNVVRGTWAGGRLGGTQWSLLVRNRVTMRVTMMTSGRSKGCKREDSHNRVGERLHFLVG